MVTRSWSIAIAMAALAWGSAAGASSIRDEGRMFSPEAVKNADAGSSGSSRRRMCPS